MNLIQYILLYFFYIFSKIVGIKISSLSGGVMMSMYGYFSKKNLIGIKNLEIAFPKKSLEEKKVILRKMWFHFGRVIGEYPHLNKIKATDSNFLKIDSIKNLLEPVKKGNCIFFSAHIGNWELSSHPLIQNGYGSSQIKFLSLLGQWSVLKNEVSSFFGEHQGWGIDVGIGNIGHG